MIVLPPELVLLFFDILFNQLVNLVVPVSVKDNFCAELS
jgi:hypothetical protein